MLRRVEPELLDTLLPDDPRAIHSRRDLRRINAWMRNPAIMSDAFNADFDGVPRKITELGAGDGDFCLRVAQRMAGRWPQVEVTLQDFRPGMLPETLAAFSKLGWRAKTVVADVFDLPEISGEIVCSNLFLHHFDPDRLAKLLRRMSKEVKLFVAVEPRRASWPLFCSRLLWAIGCNAVTRHDAVTSVRAGFAGRELSALWPDTVNWRLTECPAGAFSHLFIARRKVGNEI